MNSWDWESERNYRQNQVTLVANRVQEITQDYQPPEPIIPAPNPLDQIGPGQDTGYGTPYNPAPPDYGEYGQQLTDYVPTVGNEPSVERQAWTSPPPTLPAFGEYGPQLTEHQPQWQAPSSPEMWGTNGPTQMWPADARSSSIPTDNPLLNNPIVNTIGNLAGIPRDIGQGLIEALGTRGRNLLAQSYYGGNPAHPDFAPMPQATTLAQGIAQAIPGLVIPPQGMNANELVDQPFWAQALMATLPMSTARGVLPTAGEVGTIAGLGFNKVAPPVGRTLGEVLTGEVGAVGKKGKVPPSGTVPPKGPPTTFATPPEPPDNVIKRFTQFIHSPESLDLSKLTQEAFSEQRASRLASYDDIFQRELSTGRPVEEAHKAALEAMQGKFDRPLNDWATALTKQTQEALFARVDEVLEDGYEKLSTLEALTNAVLGKGIPRTAGIKGGSAYSRLSKVFPPEVMEALSKPKPLKQQVEDTLLTRSRPGEPLVWPEYPLEGPLGRARPLPMDITVPTDLPTSVASELKGTVAERELELADFRGFSKAAAEGKPYPPAPPEPVNYPLEGALGGPRPLPLEPFTVESGLPKSTAPPQLRGTDIERQFELLDFRNLIKAAEEGKPYPSTPLPNLEYPIDTVVKQPSMIPMQTQNVLIRGLKEAGWTAIDIGNALRAMKSGLDLSAWRQQALLIPMNFAKALKATAYGWRAGFDPALAKTAFENIQTHPYYRYYEAAGKDFLRPLEQKGIPQWQKTEQFMILGGERPIPRLMEKLPWIPWSQRSFVTLTNQMNWEMFVDFVDKVLAKNADIAAGKVAMKQGEAFNMQQSITNYAGMLADMTGRAGLGPLKELSPAMNAGFFSMRLTLGRILTPRHLLSSDPMVRKEAWKTIMGAVSAYGGIGLLGKQLGLWDVSLDSNSPDFGVIRVGPLRFDPSGGYLQYATLMSRLASQSRTSATTGINKAADIKDILTDFLFSKESPGIGLAIETLTQKTYLGEKVDYANAKQWVDRVGPMTVADMWEALEEAGVAGLAAAPLSALGEMKGAYDYPRQPEVAQKMYGKSYDKLDVKERLAVNASPDVLKSDTPLRLITSEESKKFSDVVAQTQQVFEKLPEVGKLKIHFGEVGDTIRNMPLSSKERISYQREALKQATIAIFKVTEMDGFDQLPPIKQKTRLIAAIGNARERAAMKIAQTIPQEERKARLLAAQNAEAATVAAGAAK